VGSQGKVWAKNDLRGCLVAVYSLKSGKVLGLRFLVWERVTR
jgi:hypothetical protein